MNEYMIYINCRCTNGHTVCFSFFVFIHRSIITPSIKTWTKESLQSSVLQEPHRLLLQVSWSPSKCHFSTLHFQAFSFLSHFMLYVFISPFCFLYFKISLVAYSMYCIILLMLLLSLLSHCSSPFVLILSASTFLFSALKSVLSTNFLSLSSFHFSSTFLFPFSLSSGINDICLPRRSTN